MKTIRLLILAAVVLFATNANAQTEEINKARSDIAELLKNKATVSKTLNKENANYDKNTRYYWGTQENILVLEDRIEFRLKKKSTLIYFSDLADYTIYATTGEKHTSGAVIGDFLIMLEGEVNGIKLADALKFIQSQIQNQKMGKQYGPRLILFEPVAANYRALKLKPQVSEEQRKYIVQANSFNDQKNYTKAIALYIKAIETDQTSYPAAYSNLALLSAQVGNYYDAVYYMKKYLMLMPEAEDARSAQDKIYAWEAQLGL